MRGDRSLMTPVSRAGKNESGMVADLYLGILETCTLQS
jgi:hypothetical protein